MGQYDGKDFEKLLQEAEANMMKGAPAAASPPAATPPAATPPVVSEEDSPAGTASQHVGFYSRGSAAAEADLKV